jgi:hypothetical protein
MAKIAARNSVMSRAQVVLCTIASTSRVAHELPDATIHTVIVDEAGATSEIAMPLLLRLQVPKPFKSRPNPV